MSLPDVKVIIQNGGLGGLVAFAEGVAGFICTGASVADKIQVGTPEQFFTLEDAVLRGITEADNPFAYRHLEEFYSVNPEGAELFVLLVADTMDQTDMLDSTNANGAVKLLDFAGGKIRLLASAFKHPGGYSLVTTNGLDADVFTAITNAHALALIYVAQQAPVRILIDGKDFTGVPANLTDLLTLTKNRVGVVIGSTVNTKNSSVMLALGMAANLPVQRKISRVKNGSLPIDAAYVGDLLVDNFTGLAAVHDKGYIVIRKFATLGGYFFGGDHMAAGNTDDFSLLARGRVIDKAHVIAYGTYVEEVDDEVPVTDEGLLDPGFVSYMEAKIENQINQSMTAPRQISGMRVFIDPAQNVISTNKTKVTLKVTPVGYQSEIEVSLGFDNPALT